MSASTDPVPSLDVEACVRLLTELAPRFDDPDDPLYEPHIFGKPRRGRALLSALAVFLRDELPWLTVAMQTGHWRQASSAPATGEHVLVTQLDQRGFGICGGTWQDWCAVVHYWPVEGEQGFYLSAGASSEIDDHPIQFTHWMPLQPHFRAMSLPALAARAAQPEETKP